VIGSKKLGTIRRELETALAATGADPIRWLEERMQEGKSGPNGNEVLQSLRRVLEARGRGQRRKREAGTKK
jgi:hypothetical protein